MENIRIHYSNSYLFEKETYISVLYIYISISQVVIYSVIVVKMLCTPVNTGGIGRKAT